MGKSVNEDEVELLKIISEPLRVELRFEANSPQLKQHPFFFCLSVLMPAAMRRICHSAITTLQISRGDVLFNQDERQVHPTMYFLSAGSLQYIQRGHRPCTFMKGW